MRGGYPCAYRAGGWLVGGRRRASAPLRRRRVSARQARARPPARDVGRPAVHDADRAELIDTGRAEPHRFGVTGWVSHELDDEAVELFRLSYERARVAEARKNALAGE